MIFITWPAEQTQTSFGCSSTLRPFSAQTESEFVVVVVVLVVSW